MRAQPDLKARLFSCNSLPAAKLGKDKNIIIKKKSRFQNVQNLKN